MKYCRHNLPRFEVRRRLYAIAIERGHVVAEDLAAITGLPLDRARIALWQYYRRGDLRRFGRGKYGPPLGICNENFQLNTRDKVRRMLRAATHPVRSLHVVKALGLRQRAANSVLVDLHRRGEAKRVGLGRYVWRTEAA